MASSYKQFLAGDSINTRTLLHENIPITGSIVSGTYSDLNIKNNTQDYFQSVYDYPHLSSSANHIFDITVGFHTSSGLNGPTNLANARKVHMYNQMAQVLMGHDLSGDIQRFDEDGDLAGGGTKLNEVIFLNFARLLTKDEIKKGSFSLSLGTDLVYASANETLTIITDTGADTDFKVNSPAGEYGILKSGATPYGLLFYQAGIAVLTASVFDTSSQMASAGLEDLNGFLTGSSITGSADAVRHRIYDMSFNNTTELNSTVYFCRLNANDFNYSSNPTYLEDSKIRVKNNSVDEPVSYITTIGLYSADNELLAVGKISEPLKKTPSTEITLRARLDY
jgi:hypothetical protein